MLEFQYLKGGAMAQRRKLTALAIHLQNSRENKADLHKVKAQPWPINS